MIYLITLSATASSVGGTSRPSCFRSLVDHQLGFCLLLDREVSRLLALENATTAGQHFRRIAESMATR
jgi:hypothetical protein